MAKKIQKVFESVELKDPNQVIEIQKVGLRITKENLTPERYHKLVCLSEHYKQFFNVKYQTPKKDEMESKK